MVTAVSNNANGTDILDAAAAAALTWYPLTDTAGADNTSYIDPATAAALVAVGHVNALCVSHKQVQGSGLFKASDTRQRR